MRRVGLLMSFIVAQLLTLIAVISPVWDQGWLSGFRNFFSNDQLSYAAIATNVSYGDMAFVEPFTQTNSLYYPSLWYQILGLFSRFTGIPVYTAWNVLGTLAVGTLIAALGLIAFLLSRKAWAPLAPALALFVGTLATLTSNYWYTSLEHHAVLWGAFGTFFTLNAEVIGLCLNGLAIALLAYVGFRRQQPAITHGIWILVASGALIGITANIQTYTFFIGIAIVASWACAYSLISRPSRALFASTVILLVAMFVLGQPLADRVGHIPAFALLLISLTPGVLSLARRHIRDATVFLIPLVILAAPQVIRTAFGLAEKDPFLAYRQGSTSDLGVPLHNGLIAGLPLLLVVATCLVAFGLSRRTSLSAGLLGSTFAWIVLSLNDVWGFSQEPYRLWIQGFILTALLAFTLLPTAISDGIRLARGRAAFFVLVAMSAVAMCLSLLDFSGFWKDAHEQGIAPLEDSRSQAISKALDQETGLVAAGPCIDPQLLKLVSGAPVAFENKGLAWADNRAAIQKLILEQQSDQLSVATISDTGATSLVTDSACDVTILGLPDRRFMPEVVVDYMSGTRAEAITRWRITR